MAILKCPISGLSYKCPHIPVATEYPHPVFSLSAKVLDRLFCQYMQDKLSPTEAYLLLLAYLKATGAVTFRSPCSLSPTSPVTQKLIATNIAQLMTVVEKTNAILHPSFRQPEYVVSASNSNISNISVYIEVWKNNIDSFHNNYREEKAAARMLEIERKIEYLINNGEQRLTAVKLADWADMCAEFPSDKKVVYKKLIRSCYNQERMFATSLTELQEVRDYCLAEIPQGSIHSHKLNEILAHGIQLNKDYLGYTLLEDASDTLDIIKAKAPAEKPSRTDYSSNIEFLKAKLRWSISQ